MPKDTTVAQGRSHYTHAASCGAVIRALRKERHLSLKQLGKTSGLPFQYLSKIERGEINTPLETLAIVAKALNVSMAAFFPPTHDSAPEHVLMNESRLRSALERIRTATDDIAVELKRAHHPPKTA